MTLTGWICPNCGAGLAPTSTKCDCINTWTNPWHDINTFKRDMVEQVGGLIEELEIEEGGVVGLCQLNYPESSFIRLEEIKKHISALKKLKEYLEKYN